MIKKLTKTLFAGAAFVALSAIPTMAMAGECVWADKEGYGTYPVAAPIAADQIISGLYHYETYKRYHKYCTIDQFKAKFFAENGGPTPAYGKDSVLYVPVPRRIDEADPTPASEPVKQADSNPAPAQTVYTTGNPGAVLDQQVRELQAAKSAGAPSAEIEALKADIAVTKAQIAALEAREATAGQTVVEKPIYTTKTVVQGPTAAQVKRLADLEAKVAKGEKLDADQLKELKELRDKVAAMRTDVDNLTGTTSDHETRLTKAEKLLAAIKTRTADIPWYAWVMMVLGTIGFFLGVLNLLRGAGKKEVRQDRDNVGQLAQRQFQVEFDPSNFEEQLREMKTDEVLPVTMSGVQGKAVAFCKKLRWGKVQVGGNESRQIDISQLRYFLSQRYDQGGFNAPEPDPA